MKLQTLACLAGGATAFILALSSVATAQHGATAPAPFTANLQVEQSSWIHDPHWHSYFDLTRTAFAPGPSKVDVAAY